MEHETLQAIFLLLRVYISGCTVNQTIIPLFHPVRYYCVACVNPLSLHQSESFTDRLAAIMAFVLNPGLSMVIMFHATATNFYDNFNRDVFYQGIHTFLFKRLPKGGDLRTKALRERWERSLYHSELKDTFYLHTAR